MTIVITVVDTVAEVKVVDKGLGVAELSILAIREYPICAFASAGRLMMTTSC